MKIILVSLATLVSAQAFAAESVNVVSVAQSGNLMPSPGIVTHNIVTTFKITVPSGGCTSASDFDVAVEHVNEKAVVEFVRTKQDFCEAYLPDGVTFEISTNKIGAHQEMSIKNPLMVRYMFAY